MLRFTFLFLLSVPSVQVSFAQSEQSMIKETHEALSHIYDSLNGDEWDDNSGWDVEIVPATMSSFNNWYGITVYGEEDDSLRIDLSDNNLKGEPSSFNLPDNHIGTLTSLTHLDMSDNKIEQWGQFRLNNPNLKVLNLSDNSFGLGFFSNRLESFLDDKVLLNLEVLDLSDNGIIDRIPVKWGDMKNLRVLDLSNNEISSSIPVEIGNLTNLRELNLSKNTIGRVGFGSDKIPAEIGNLSNLEILNLSDNLFTGSIPAEIGNLSNLEILNLSDNLFTGNIPRDFVNLSNLEILDVGGTSNELTGSIPPELGSTNLRILNLEWNKLTGNIPPQLGNLSNLEVLNLGGTSNRLTGSIPPELGGTNLRILNLEWNDLEGNIPPELGNLSNLDTLNLFRNEFTGSIPRSFLNLQLMEFRWALNDGLCAPPDEEFQGWLDGFTSVGPTCISTVSVEESNSGLPMHFALHGSLPIMMNRDSEYEVSGTLFLEK
ncbi:MAG: leucine-rich repeat domain-containing protein [Bacteroidetes bacterium]|nr:leucine-rich repeat domain-containing protein [Bacteroidota bacterium]